MLEDGNDFGRYLDVDGDGIPYRTYPGTHPTKGSYFTRGTTKDRYARYSEEGAVYADNMQRLLKKFETAQDLVPAPAPANAGTTDQYGVIYFGSTSPAMDEALDLLEARGHQLNACASAPSRSTRACRASSPSTTSSSWSSRTATPSSASCIVNENGSTRSASSRSLHYDGTPITARFIAEAMATTRIASRWPRSERPCHDLHRQAQAPSSGPQEERGRLHAPRLRGQDLDPVRRLRPRLDHGRDHPGLLRARHPAAPRGQALRHRLLVRRRRTISSAARTASTPCTAACRRC